MTLAESHEVCWRVVARGTPRQRPYHEPTTDLRSALIELERHAGSHLERREPLSGWWGPVDPREVLYLRYIALGMPVAIIRGDGVAALAELVTRRGHE